MVIIPLTTDPDQQMVCSIPVDGKNLNLRLRIRFNAAANYWYMTIINPKTNMVIVDNVPLITGQYPAADILAPYSYLGLGSACVVNVSSSQMDFPDSTNLGTDFVLAWGDTGG